MKILVNDDFELVTRQVKYILEREFDYEILVFNDSCEALEAFRHDNEIGLILTDLKMPDMDGIEFAREVLESKRAKSGAAQMPPKIVLITAVNKTDCFLSSVGTDCDHLKQAIDSGYFSEILFKPVSRDELVLCVSKLLSKGNLSSKRFEKNSGSVESICAQIDQAIPTWDRYELDAFKKYLDAQMEQIEELQSKPIVLEFEASEVG